MSNEFFILTLGAGYLFVINLSAYCAFYFDKKLAQNNERRISESTLLTLALCGGSAGAISAQHQFRHKTKKQPFKSQLYTIAVLQIVALIALLVPGIRTEVLSALG